MAHIALYREFRPATFNEVIGQDHIVKTLQNQIKNNTTSHAYLFCGTRGTGKTSCAKIFAKAVNCQNPQNGSPCGKCDVCKSIAANGNLDIMEIDAASNNRVDEIRDLKEKVNYLPSVGKFKVYIIDEVHMLTDSAFNALLKTLEEPPKHIIFILATTEPQKLPATILSRCMRFDFKLVAQPDLVSLLSKVFDKTQTAYEPSALEQIAKAGKGSVRDTLSVAEMCKAFANNNITYNSVMQCLGLTEDKVLFEISTAIVEKNGQKVLDILEHLYTQGKNIAVLLSDLCGYFQTLLSVKLGANMANNLPVDVANNFIGLAEKTDAKYLLGCLKKLCDAENAIKFCTSEKVFAQTTLLGLFYDDNLEIAILKNKVAELQNFLNADVIQKKTVIESPRQVEVEVKQDLKPGQQDAVEQSLNYQAAEQLLQKVVTDDTPFSDVTTQTEGGHAASEIFGRLIKHARQNSQMMLFAGMADVDKVDLQNAEIIFVCNSQDCVDLILKHKQFILNFVEQFGLKSISAVVKQDQEKIRMKRLKDLLGDKLKII